jgi:hypothetical protein
MSTQQRSKYVVGRYCCMPALVITRGVCNVWSGNPFRFERGRNFGNLDLLLRARALPEGLLDFRLDLPREESPVLAGGCNGCNFSELTCTVCNDGLYL